MRCFFFEIFISGAADEVPTVAKATDNTEANVQGREQTPLELEHIPLGRSSSLVSLSFLDLSLNFRQILHFERMHKSPKHRKQQVSVTAGKNPATGLAGLKPLSVTD